jgi:hypothetical protein
MEQRRHGCAGNAELVADLVVRETLELAPDKRLPLPVGELADRRRQAFVVRRRRGVLGTRALRELGRDHSRASSAEAAVAHVVRDGQQPGKRVPDLGTVTKCEPRSQERVLDCVGRLVVTEPARAESADARRVALVQRTRDGASRRVVGPHDTAAVASPPR